MKLSVIEYDAIMQAINNYKAELSTRGLGLEWAGNEEGYTEESIKEALERVEEFIMVSNLPF